MTPRAGCRAFVRRRLASWIFPFGLSAIFFLIAFSTLAQTQETEPIDRVYKHSKVEVEQALQSLQAYATSRLPTLDGFANANAGTLTKFENPHYQFLIDIDSQGPRQTLVTISAKITAWSAGTDTVGSRYVVIPSNGRLEQDMLDRLSVLLEKGPAGKSNDAPDDPAPLPAAPTAPSVPPRPAATSGGVTPSSHAAASPGSSGATAAAPAPAPTPAAAPKSSARVNPADPASLASEIAAIQAQRQQSELTQRRLQQQISELQANASTQKYLSNLAVVKTPQAPVFQQDDDTSKVLFRADPEDEFEVIATKGTWFHVRLENGADGWLRAAQLQPPQEVDDAEDAAAAINFTTPNQEIKPFGGEWAALKGKPALFVFAQPSRAIPNGILGQSQFQFAKHIFTEGYREAQHSEQPMSGVVVVFLGDKGGVAAATLADIRRWRDGAISEKAFLERCSLDPPESFRDSPASNR